MRRSARGSRGTLLSEGVLLLLAKSARKAGVGASDRTIGEDDGLSDPLAYFSLLQEGFWSHLGLCQLYHGD